MACDLAVQIIPECMAPLARQLMAHLASLQPSAVLAIPIIELSSDSSAVENFYQFFQICFLLFQLFSRGYRVGGGGGGMREMEMSKRRKGSVRGSIVSMLR